MTFKPRKRRYGTRIREDDKRPGKILNIFRKDLGISQVRIGEIIDCSYQQAAKYFDGSNRMSPARILAAAEHLKVSPAVFFREAEHAADINDLLNRAILEYRLIEIQEVLTIEEINWLIYIANITFDLNNGKKNRDDPRKS